ncbi:MAG: tRNA (guanosine(46)-N7)-methyltransferase TrmB [Candidatus Azobacteroides sp.]|nr:tRNA (guanosine(46)-N7)-methyltransferase TrmB [Candidatus Azobacteroides sp.]
MGKNKLQKFSDMSFYPHVFQYPFSVLKEKGFELKANWNDAFFKNDHPIVLELGCGKGEYTVGLAELFPDKNFIGVDIKGARMWTGAKQSSEKGLTNVAFIRTQIELIDHFFGPGEVAEIWLTFPDPQMRKVGKRLTSSRFLRLYRKFLLPEGIIHLKTDSNFLYAYTWEMIKLNDFPVLADTDDLYHSNVADDILSIQTFYEKQWRERGLNIKYLKFVVKEKAEIKEPDIEIPHDIYRSYHRGRLNELFGS